MSVEENMTQYLTENHAENDTEINAITSSNLCDSVYFLPSVAKGNFVIAITGEQF